MVQVFKVIIVFVFLCICKFFTFFQSAAGISILPDYHKLRKYNFKMVFGTLQNANKQQRKQEKKEKKKAKANKAKAEAASTGT